MNSEEDRQTAKTSYEKPTAIDLGPASPVVGASCAVGDQFHPDGDVCTATGNSATDVCNTTGNGVD